MRYVLVAAGLAFVVGTVDYGFSNRKMSERLGALHAHADGLRLQRLTRRQLDSYHYDGLIRPGALPVYCSATPSPAGGYDITCR